jgi:thioredoxin-like negative regulator of GroEL
LAKKFNIRSWPVLVYLKDGKVQAQEVGVRSAQEIEQNVQKFFK